MPRFIVPATYTFRGEFSVEAVNKLQAAEFVEKHCGLVLGGNIHCSLPDAAINWNFPVHPVKGVALAKIRKETE